MNLRTFSIAAIAAASLYSTTACEPAKAWARYDIAAGSHTATVTLPTGAPVPRAGFHTVSGRTFDIQLNNSFHYLITNPTQPEDQFDWNKFPGLSDCGQLDLSVNGAMFVWRWRVDVTPNVLEIGAYANNDSVHLDSGMMATLTDADLATNPELHLSFTIGGNWNEKYLFALTGTVNGRTISANAELPRQCPTTSISSVKWASGLYFGGTSVAPTPIHAGIIET